MRATFGLDLNRGRHRQRPRPARLAGYRVIEQDRPSGRAGELPFRRPHGSLSQTAALRAAR